MRVALLFDPWLLSARGTLDLDGYRDDNRGMTGSEQCAIRLYEELGAMRHTPLLFTKAENYSKSLSGMVLPWEERGTWDCDVAISINCPDPLRDVRAKFKACYALLNDFTFCKAGFEQHVDLFASPSQPHLDQVLHNPDWHRVEVTWDRPEGKAQYEPDPAKWCVVPLGCDPERVRHIEKLCPDCGGKCPHEPECPPDICKCRCYGSGRVPMEKVPGRVIYCSSPDRGLHLLLQEWAHIKRAVPHAKLRIFYRLRDWVGSMKAQIGPDGFVHPHVFPNVQRALYIDECLYRLSEPKWGIEVHDSVSRATIEREMAEAEVMAYPLSPLNAFSEGFSCSTLESCAARACPITTDADAFRGLYGDVLPLTERSGDWVPKWRDNVIRALTDEVWREAVNDKAEAFAKELTWKNTSERLMAEIRTRMPPDASTT